MNNKKIFVYFLLVIALVAFAYMLRGVFDKGVKGNSASNGRVCTMDAFQCADGSYVGRSGPDCQFVCPTPRSTSTKPMTKETSLQGGIGETVSGQGINITPTKIAEDSRCPVGVQCIQAGTVRVLTSITGGEATTTTFTLDKPLSVGSVSITLISVNPVREQGKTIKNSDYRLTWRILKK